MKKLTLGLVILAMVAAVSVQAATKIYWNGSVDNLYTNGVNWNGGAVPANTDYTDQAVFQNSSLSGVMSKTCTLTSSLKINAILFYDAGFSINGSEYTTKYFSSTGSGTNTIYRLKSVSGTAWTIGTGNTLIVSQLYQDGQGVKLTFKGGGTIFFNTYIKGWGDINYQQIDDVTMIVNANKVYDDGNNNYITKLNLESSELQLKTTVSAAEALITASKITKGTTVADKDFYVTDLGPDYLGGGYVSISYTPPTVTGTVLIVK